MGPKAKGRGGRGRGGGGEGRGGGGRGGGREAGAPGQGGGGQRTPSGPGSGSETASPGSSLQAGVEALHLSEAFPSLASQAPGPISGAPAPPAAAPAAPGAAALPAAAPYGAPTPSTAAAPPLPGAAAAPRPSVHAPPQEPVAVERAERGVSSSALIAAPRPGFGTEGRPCQLWVNHFKIEFSRDLTIHHYDIAITPDAKTKARNRMVVRTLIAAHQKELGGTAQRPVLPVYDGGKSIYSARAFTFQESRFDVMVLDEDSRPGAAPASAAAAGAGGGDGKRGREYSVKVALAGRYDMESLVLFLQGRATDIPQTVLQGLDIALREQPVGLYSPVGPSFFSESFGSCELGGGVAGWRGFYQSVRPTQQGLVLNVDVSASGFHRRMPVLQFAQQLFNKPQGFNPSNSFSDHERVKLRRAITRLQVNVTHRDTPRRYRISGLSRQPIGAIEFEIEGRGMVRLVDYFRETYNYQIRFPNLPAVQCGKSALPIECCIIVEGQRYGPKLNEQHVSELLKFTCTRPDVRSRDIHHIMGRNDYQRDPHALEFGMHVNPQMTRVQGRILHPPKLAYRDGRPLEPRFGAWNMMGGQQLVNGATIVHWGILNLCNLPPPAVGNFGQALVSRCRDLGVQINPNMVFSPLAGNVYDVQRPLLNVMKQAKDRIPQGQHLQLLIVLLPERGTFYNDIKRICETELNLVTQCVLRKHAMRAQSQYLANLILKINVKCGGRNVLLSSEYLKRLPMVHEKATIVFGADVSHPPPGDDSAPSIAAVVASKDWPCANKYGCVLRTQGHRREIIEGLHEESVNRSGVREYSGIVRKLLFEFYTVCRQKPDRLIFFRDGVSEGQFYQVLAEELSAVRKACLGMQPDGSYQPAITYVVVQKRHHTRMFPADNNKDRNGNVCPGTVVDRQICHPREFDFFLNSHASIQGTSRPTHYRVLWDENRFTADSMQTLCYHLCHTYARCTRTVSIVPPAYYADLAATRASLYLTGMSGSTRGSGSEGGSQAGDSSRQSGQAGQEAGPSQPGAASGVTESSSSSSRITPPPVPPLPEVMPVPRLGMFFC